MQLGLLPVVANRKVGGSFILSAIETDEGEKPYTVDDRVGTWRVPEAGRENPHDDRVEILAALKRRKVSYAVGRISRQKQMGYPQEE